MELMVIVFMVFKMDKLKELNPAGLNLVKITKIQQQNCANNIKKHAFQMAPFVS